MGQDKALLPLGDRRVIDHVIARLRPQVETLAVNANGPLPGVEAALLPDTVPGRPGPLAGILAAMDWAAGQGFAAVVTVPVDTPFLPADLVEALVRAGPPAVARTDRVHPVCGLWPVTARDGLRDRILAGLRRVQAWDVAAGATPVRFPDDSLTNLNTPDDLAAARARLPCSTGS